MPLTVMALNRTQSQIKLLLVLPSMEFGGIERTTINLLRNIKKVQTAVVLHRRIEHRFYGINCKIYRFEDFGAFNPTLSIRSIYAYSKAIKEISVLENSDIVLGIMQFAPIYVCFAKDLFFMKSKVLISYRGVVSEYFRIVPFNIWARLLVRFSIRRASGIIVPSEGVKRDLIAHFGATESNTRVIYNGIDLDFVRIASKETINLNKDCPWIATSARLDTVQKDFLTLLKAFRIVRDSLKARLLIIGDGPQREEILSWIKEMSLQGDVLLLGFQENPFKYISKADVFVLSSFVEGFGNVIVEAMALGIPVISSNCPSGPGEIITHGLNGLLVPVKDHETMAHYILDILTNTDLRNRLSLEGFKRSEDFSSEKMANEYEKVLFYFCKKD